MARLKKRGLVEGGRVFKSMKQISRMQECQSKRERITYSKQVLTPNYYFQLYLIAED